MITLPHLLRRSLTHRRARSLSALIALTVSAAVATALLTLYASLDTKLHNSFRSFGANIVLTASALNAEDTPKAQSAAGPGAHLAPFAYAVATTDRGTPVVVAGTNLAAVKVLDPWWQVASWPQDKNGLDRGVLLGEKAAGFIADEKQLTLTYGGNKFTPGTEVQITRLKTGDEEDSRIYMDFHDFCALTTSSIPPQGGQGANCVPPTVLEIQIPGGVKQVEAAQHRLQQAFPQATVTPIRQLVEGESRIVDRTHALMFAAVLLIALTVAVSVLATLSASVLERRRDFALMKALGAPESHLVRLFLLETLLLALAGVLAGYAIGSLAAFTISELNFSTSTYPSLPILPLVLTLNLLIAALAALLPTRSLRNLQPAALLKGE